MDIKKKKVTLAFSELLTNPYLQETKLLKFDQKTGRNAICCACVSY